MTATPYTTQTPAPTLAGASVRQMLQEALRRAARRLDTLLGKPRWTALDWVFGGIVAVLALGSTGFFTTIYRVNATDPDYYYNRSLAALAPGTVDLIETGAIAEPGQEAEAMPAPQVSRAIVPTPQDYEIVMLFGEEVFLATPRELMRAKVGSSLPGLGTMLSIDGRSVRFENATLTAVGD